MESGPIEWEEFKEAFLRKYFPRERREVNQKEFINVKQRNMIVEEYSSNSLCYLDIPHSLCLMNRMK